MTTAPWRMLTREQYDVGVRCFLGLHRFAELTDTPYDRLQRWRIYGPVWVPPPVVQIGRWPGWPLPLIQAWTPDWRVGSPPDPWPWPYPTFVFADSITMCREHKVASAGLWLRISQGDIPRPEVWIDNRPGWTPPPETTEGQR